MNGGAPGKGLRRAAIDHRIGTVRQAPAPGRTIVLCGSGIGVTVQTTLLGLAIGLILALLAALIGPHFINWNDHRAFFEAEASRLTGLKVRVTGNIDADILPFPSMRLAGIAVGPEDQPARLTARSLRIEFGLGALLRGELRAVEMRLIGPSLSLGLDRNGELDWPSLALDADALSIERLRIEGGRATLTDAVSHSRLVLDQVQFEGEVRSLAGPLRGRGFFTAGGIGYGYNVSAGRYGDDGIRMRLGLETAERPELMEAEGLVSFDRAAPRFEGNIILSRPAGTVLATGKAVAHEPWKLSAKVKTGAKWAALSEIVFQYGPHEWGTSLLGSGQFRFGEQPHIEADLRARQLDLDRMLATSNTPRRLPLPAIQAFAEMLGGALRPPWPVALRVNVDAVTLGGAPLQGISASLRSDGPRWQLDRLEFRAPGLTQVGLNGQLEPLGKALGFAGDVSMEAGDPKALVGWLSGQPATGAPIRPWRVTGTVTLGGGGIAVENLRSEFDQGAVGGRAAYFWAAGNRPARLEAVLRAAEIDFDAMAGFGEAGLANLGFEWPREVTLALEIGHARIAGLEVREADAQLKLDANGLAIERLSIADFGNATVKASGRIQTAMPQGGNVTIDVDARDLGGMIKLADRFAPMLAAPLRRLGGPQQAAKLRAGLSLTNAGNGNTRGTLDVSGRIGAIRISLAAGATGKPASFFLSEPSALGDTDKSIDSRLEADDGRALLAVLGLERIAAAEAQPARLIFSAHGVRGGELRVETKLSADPIDAEGEGILRFAREQPTKLDLDRFAGSIGGHAVKGKLAFSFGEALRVDGALETETLDVPATIAAAAGLPAWGGASAGEWSSAPFSTVATGLAGRIAFRADRATIMGGAEARQVRGVARFGPTEVVFEDVAGEVANGRLEGRLSFANGASGVAARLRLALSGADAGAFFTDGEAPPVTGRLTLQIELAGSGRSPAAFFGSLSGTGTVGLDAAQLAGLNPGVFDAAVRAAELGMPTEGRRLHEFANGVLDSARLQVSKAEATINAAAGQARFSNVAVRAMGADLEVTANLDLGAATLDALLTLRGLPSAPGAARPILLITLNGELPVPRRTVDTGLFASWLTLRAVEQQSQQIDAMEKARRDAAAREARREQPAGAAPRLPELAPAVPKARSNEGVPAEQAPPLSPPVDVPAGPRPRSAPRAESAPPLAPSAPARAGMDPPGLVGAQN
jgi:large subunit ribosomal protein L24